MARIIMIQGTMSNVGKSLLTAGLCRIFRQDGYRVAPFKSQNMALNSHVTDDGFEIGRAQAMQAEACGIAPTVHMNPILLKPTTDMGSQVILQGEVAGTMHATDYFRQKKSYIPIIRQSFDILASEHDIIVIEGAGSPAEINLKQDDIVNMGLAELLDAPVLLVGDIDRGGVFAQLVGTMTLLEQHEQARVKGFLINKFRGDRSLLSSGLSMLEEKTGKPVLGVIPYTEIDVEDEDSLSGSLTRTVCTDEKNVLDVAVIRLPRISNFTDFQPLAMEKQIRLRYVERVSQLGTPDLLILPGTKNTISDLLWLRESNLEAAVLRLAENDTPLIGICGGYQMLGRFIYDDAHTESSADLVRGLGLLPIKTRFAETKTRTRVSGVLQNMQGVFVALNNTSVSGYEIHMGQTEFAAEKKTDGKPEKKAGENRAIRLDDEIGENRAIRLDEKTGGKWDGYSVGNVFGTYLHGLFDEPKLRHGLIRALCEKSNIPYEESDSVSYMEYKEKQYDKLADVLRENIDMEAVYAILGES